ncbi:MAG: NAD(P)-binding domain-containing protein [Proteobacteria bacterium]|jgi:thioredoxin reductase (NADPH)|nr:NAD(P)-binding domain-containing protein [Pseudomonadota bacterium]
MQANLPQLDLPLWLISYGLLAGLILVAYLVIRHRNHRQSHATLNESLQSGLTEPASLHPVIDPARCLGCGACVTACPEKKILGLIGGKARLVSPSSCIGHGACKTACPFEAITLVFGTEKRGIDIPAVKPNFETNIPGLFIAGELGGMGLIRNAVRQGSQAIDAVARLDGIGTKNGLDVVIVGAGPAGIAASLKAMQHKLRFITLEQDSLGGTVAHYPRGKIVMTAPVELPLIGKMQFRETTKESLMAFWQSVQQKTGLTINANERVEKIESQAGGFLTTTSQGTYRSRAILLAIGRRGTPRKLGVPGEGSSKVVYRLIDPGQYQGQNVLIVGGGDSALEAATSIAAEPAARVTISYRSEAFNRAKPKNRDKVLAAVAAGQIQVFLQSTVREIRDTSVTLVQDGRDIEIANDAVIVSAGGILPTPFLKSIGIEVETKYGTA